MNEVVMSLAMLFAGGIGSMGIMYLRRIATTLDAQALIVADIDKRVVRVETQIVGTKEGNHA